MGRLLVLLMMLAVSGCALKPGGQVEVRIGQPDRPVELFGFLPQDLEVGGEILISADLTVPAGRTLRILPGTSVRVRGNDSTKIDPEYLDKGTEILVRGRLEVMGTEAEPVSFRLDPETPVGESWSGIEVVRGGTIRLQHIDIVSAEIAVLLDDAKAELQKVNLLGSRYGMLLQGDSRLLYFGGRISGGDAGLLCYDRAELRLQKLQILDNQEEGLYLAVGCSLQAEELLVTRNDLGLIAASRPASGLEVRDNRVDFKPLGNLGSAP